MASFASNTPASAGCLQVLPPFQSLFRRTAQRVRRSAIESRECMIELRPESVLFVRPFLAITAGIVVLFVGKALNRRFGPLREYNVPEPVTGGLLVAITLWLVF